VVGVNIPEGGQGGAGGRLNAKWANCQSGRLGMVRTGGAALALWLARGLLSSPAI
jgi:hypothetical protein